MNAAALILLVPLSLLLGALLQLLAAWMRSARGKGVLALACAVPALLAVGTLLPAVRGGQAIDLNLAPWDGPLALVLHVDALSVLFAFMGTAIGALVLLYSVGYMAEEKAATRFYATMLVFIGGFVGLVFSANLFLLYLCWEVVGLCSFTLVGFWYANPEAVRGARKVLLMTHIAGYGLLAAILLLYSRSGSALWTDARVAASMSTGVFLLLLVAVVAKSVQFPLHTWIPEAMAAPTPVSALLHAACYVKAGVYLVARLHGLGAWPVAWSAALVWIATVTMAVGVMYAMVQTDLKRMLAYSTVSQIGYMMLGLGIGTPLAITAGLLHCLNHGFFKGGLFLTAGAVQHATGTRDMNRLGGLAQKMPRTMLSWLVGVGSMMGIPLMSGFASKWMLYTAALEAGWAIPAMVAWAVSLGTVFLGAKATSAVFLGPTTEATAPAQEAAPTMLWGMGVLAAVSIVLGVMPQLAVNLLLNPVLLALGLGAGVHVSWLGLSADAGNFSTVGGLVLAVVSILIGGAIYAIAHVSRGETELATAGGGVFTGGEPLGEDDRLTAGDFSEIFRENWQAFFHWTNVDAVYSFVGRQLNFCACALSLPVKWMEEQATALTVALAAAVFILVRWIAPGVQPQIARGVSLMPEPCAPWLLLAALALAAVALLLASFACRVKSRFPLWAGVLLTGFLSAGGLATGNAWARLALLELGAGASVVLVWASVRKAAARHTYLAVVLLSALAAICGELLCDAQNQAWARAFLLTGILVKLSAVPVLFWLLSVADELPALVLGLIVAVVDMAAYGEFLLRIPLAPSVITPPGLLLAVAMLTAFCGALLMLKQRSLKRLLVLSTVEDVGFLLLGVRAASLQGAVLAAATHALAKALLFVCLVAPEADGALAGRPKGLATRYPVSAFGFLFGMLAMLGVPPLLGFAGRWRLYLAAHAAGAFPLTIFLAASILALTAYVMSLTHVWWGAKPEAAPEAHEPLVVRLAIVLLAVALLAGGLWPQLAAKMMEGVR